MIFGVLLLAIGGLDVNYLDLKKQLVDNTHVPQLVVDAAGGDYSDHDLFGRPKARQMLNDGNRRLEESLIELKPVESLAVEITAGQYELNAPGFRYVNGVELVQDDVVVAQLRRDTKQGIRQRLGKPIHLLDRARPQWWHRRCDADPVEREFAPYAAFSVPEDEAEWATKYLQDTFVYRDEIYDMEYIGEDGFEVVVRSTTGAVVRRFPVAGSMGPWYGYGKVWVATTNTLYAYTTKGKLVTSFRIFDGGTKRVAFSDREVFVYSAGGRCNVYSLTGAELRDWTGDWTFDFYPAIRADEDYVYISDMNTVHITDRDGLSVGEFSLPGDTRLVGVVDGVIYVTSDHGTGQPFLASYNREGEQIQKWSLPEPELYGIRAFVDERYMYWTSYSNGFTVGPTPTPLETFDATLFKSFPVRSAADITIAPPSDGAYTAMVFGGRYASEFELDDDETWCSVNCPNALLLMAQAYVELRVFNNFASFRRFEQQALTEALEAWHNKVWEQVKGIPRDESRLGPSSLRDLKA